MSLSVCHAAVECAGGAGGGGGGGGGGSIISSEQNATFPKIIELKLQTKAAFVKILYIHFSL
jgi:hypothetical protein